VTGEQPRILTVRRAEHSLAETPDGQRGSPAEALPFGPLDPGGHRTLELGLRAWVKEQTGLDLGYAEQLYTFGDRHRDPRELSGGPRVISVGYLALVRETRVEGAGEAAWCSAYDFFPWEDWRAGQPEIIEQALAPALALWAKGAAESRQRRRRRERVDITFGLRGATFDPERVLERYELLYEAGLVPEAARNGSQPTAVPAAPLGRPMSLDHRRVLATAIGRLRGKLKYRPVVFELLPASFTLLQLQRLVEALVGVRLHKQNFRRLVETAGLVEGTGVRDVHTGGRPAELFRFRREVLRERAAPGVGLPGVRRQS
jgi:hypothetical protein